MHQSRVTLVRIKLKAVWDRQGPGASAHVTSSKNKSLIPVASMNSCMRVLAQVKILPWPKKIVTAEKFMRLIRQSNHVKSCDIKLGFDIDATRGSARRELALQIEVDLERYHMIAVRIYLMNISAVTIFFGQGSRFVASAEISSAVLPASPSFSVLLFEVRMAFESGPAAASESARFLVKTDEDVLHLLENAVPQNTRKSTDMWVGISCLVLLGTKNRLRP